MFDIRRLTLILVALFTFATLTLPIGVSYADPNTGAQAPTDLRNMDALLSKIRADYPAAQILKAELHRGEEEGDPTWIYKVKLFPPDGRIMKLIYDARTLVLIGAYGRHEGGPRRMRFRHGWHGGRND